MSRPAFQFYHGDWRKNANLRRCSFHERGVWADTLCVLADSDEFGIVRWPLAELAHAVGCKVGDLRALFAKKVLKGADAGEKCQAYVYTPRHGRRDGAPVTLIEAQAGPIWYSSRMVRDEYVRLHRGAATRFDGDEAPPKTAPMIPFGDGSMRQPNHAPTRREGDGPSSSPSSSKEGRMERSPASARAKPPDRPAMARNGPETRAFGDIVLDAAKGDPTRCTEAYNAVNVWRGIGIPDEAALAIVNRVAARKGWKFTSFAYLDKVVREEWEKDRKAFEPDEFGITPPRPIPAEWFSWPKWRRLFTADFLAWMEGGSDPPARPVADEYERCGGRPAKASAVSEAGEKAARGGA